MLRALIQKTPASPKTANEILNLFSKNPLSATNSVEDEINASAPLALGSKKPLIFPSPGK